MGKKRIDFTAAARNELLNISRVPWLVWFIFLMVLFTSCMRNCQVNDIQHRVIELERR